MAKRSSSSAIYSPILLLAKCFWSCCWSIWWCETGCCGSALWPSWCADCECDTRLPFWLLPLLFIIWWLWLFTFIGEMRCADWEEGTLIAELLDIMLVGLIRTAEFVGLVYGISSSVDFPSNSSLISISESTSSGKWFFFRSRKEEKISIKFQLKLFSARRWSGEDEWPGSEWWIYDV